MRQLIMLITVLMLSVTAVGQSFINWTYPGNAGHESTLTSVGSAVFTGAGPIPDNNPPQGTFIGAWIIWNDISTGSHHEMQIDSGDLYEWSHSWDVLGEGALRFNCDVEIPPEEDFDVDVDLGSVKLKVEVEVDNQTYVDVTNITLSAPDASSAMAVAPQGWTILYEPLTVQAGATYTCIGIAPVPGDPITADATFDGVSIPVKITYALGAWEITCTAPTPTTGDPNIISITVEQYGVYETITTQVQ